MGPGLLRGETGCPYHCSCLQSSSPLQSLIPLPQQLLMWLGREGQEWAQAWSDVSQAVLTTSPAFNLLPLCRPRALRPQNTTHSGPLEQARGPGKAQTTTCSGAIDRGRGSEILYTTKSPGFLPRFSPLLCLQAFTVKIYFQLHSTFNFTSHIKKYIHKE